MARRASTQGEEAMKRKRLPLPTMEHRVKPKLIDQPTYWSPE